MEPRDSKKDMLSIRLTEDPAEGQGRIIWNGNYGKYWAQVFRTQAMGRSKLTTSDQTSLAKLGELLLKYTAIIGIETKRSKKPCGESAVSIDTDGDAL